VNTPFQQSTAATELAKRAIADAHRARNSRLQSSKKDARNRLMRLLNAMSYQHFGGEPVHQDQWEQLAEILDILNNDA
jgi:hypothetical protein